MNYEELKEWLLKGMQMDRNYQPIAIRTLLQNDNKSTEDEIRKEIRDVNHHFLPDNKTQYPFVILKKHKVVRFNESEKKYELILDEPLSITQRDELIQICDEKIGSEEFKTEIDNLVDRGVSESVIMALRKFLHEGQIFKTRTRDALSNPKRKYAIPKEEQQDEEYNDDQILHGMVKGVYKAKGENFAQALMMRPESKYKLEIDRTYRTLRINYDFMGFEKYSTKGNNQIGWLEKSQKEDIPIGVVFGYDKNKWLILGLCKVKERPTKTHFILESYGISDEMSTAIKENAIQKYDRYHTSKELRNVPDADWGKIFSDVVLEDYAIQKEIKHKNSEPTINYILDQIDDGTIAIPRFQRYYEWKPEQVTSLLRSIFHEFFIGSLLMWDIKDEHKERCGMIPVQGSNPDNLKGEQLTIDGQQRITSLYYAIRGPDPTNNKEEKHPGYFYINYNNYINNGDGEDDIVQFKKKIPDQETFNKLYFPCYYLDPPKRDKWFDELKEYVKPSNSEDRDKLDKSISNFRQKLNRFLFQYTIPQQTLSNVNFDKIATVFQNLNTEGTRLGLFALMSVKMWANNVDLRTLWKDTTDEHPNLHRYDKNLKTDMGRYIMESISLSFSTSKSCKREDILNMIADEKWKPDEFKNMWNDTSKYINEAIIKLESKNEDGFGVTLPKILPYEPMLPILASLLREIDVNFRDDESNCYDKLQKWYWVSVFGRRFSDSVESKKKSDYNDIVEWFGDKAKIPRFITNFEAQFKSLILREETRGAIYNGMMCILAKNGLQDFEIRVSLKHEIHMDHIFPHSRHKTEYGVNSILNMTWLSKETNTGTKKARMPSEYIKEVMTKKYDNNKSRFLKVLSSHLISEKGLHALLKDDFKEFLSLREEEIQKEIASRTGVKYVNLDEFPTQTDPESKFDNKIIVRNAIEACNKELILISKYLGYADLKTFRAMRELLNVKKIRLLTSKYRADKELQKDFRDFRDDMNKKYNIKCEMKVMSKEAEKEQHARYIADPEKCYNTVDSDVALMKKTDDVSPCKIPKNLEKWWDSSFDIMNQWKKIQDLLDEMNKE